MIPTNAVAIFPWRTPWTVEYRVTVEIFRFDGPLGGPAVLNARWRLLDGNGKELVLRVVNLSEAATEPSPSRGRSIRKVARAGSQGGGVIRPCQPCGSRP